MNKKIIIAVCGPSASGKDHLVNLLSKSEDLGEVNKIVRDTTRPPRELERNGVDYNFISSNVEFLNKACDKAYLEYSKYRGWCYGTLKNAIGPGINIGVFDYKGLEQLLHKGDYFVIPIYCKCSFKLRLKRSYNREGRFKFEYLRRGLSDLRDYFKFKRILPLFPWYKFLDCENLYPKEQVAVMEIFINFCLRCFGMGVKNAGNVE